MDSVAHDRLASIAPAPAMSGGRPRRSVRTGRIRLLGALALLCALLGAAPSASAAEQRPNFVHILTDDQTIDSIKRMPFTKRLLRKRGTKFKNHHAVQPLCCPARASFLSGQYPHNNGVLSNNGPHSYRAFDFDHTLYTALDDAGYETGWIGKVMNVSGDEGLVPEPGFDEWFAPLPGSLLEMFDFTVSDNGTPRRFNDVHQNVVFAHEARQFIKRAGDDPFMLTLALTSPHWVICEGTEGERCPPEPEPRDLGRFAGAKFPLAKKYDFNRAERTEANRWWRRELESLQSVDRIVRSLIGQLRGSGQLANTYVIFQSDNGYTHGEHGYFDKNIPWDRSVRVPLLIRGPGFKRKAVRDDLTANVDLPATILDAARVAPPVPQDGYSLLSKHKRRYLLMEKLLSRRLPEWAAWQQIKTRRGWTYWRRRDNVGRRHLYHLPSDPLQLDNRYREKRKLGRRLERRLRRSRDCAAPCP